MKRDWFCPCLLFFIGAIWLAVSLYLSTRAWLRLRDVERDYVKGVCVVSATDSTPCSVLDGGRRVDRCRLTLFLYFDASGAAPPARKPAATPIRLPGPANGCIFRNCGKAREWRDARVANDRMPCWARRRGAQRVTIDNPAGNARRDSIMFTAFAAAAALIAGSMLVVMAGLLCTRRE